MLAKKFPELKKPINYAKKMSWFERWRDIQFHKNLAKVDERMLHLQWEIDARAKEKVEIASKMKVLGDSTEKIHAVTGLSTDIINSL